MYSTTDVVTTLHHGTAFEIDRTRAVCVALLLALCMAGEALERSGSKAQAVPFYEAVIERAEQGHSTVEASHAAFFLGLS